MDKEIRELAGNLVSLGAKAVCLYSKEVDAVIDSDSKDKHLIEMLLDGMLGFCWDKNMLKLYKKLCRYYYGIDSYAIASYVIAYREMWDSESLRK
ncbi:MAG: hypothetical protein A2X47_04000 [Lentisphaerae bacterium GWF2_38_69]|nr:MAG: hypothetical protein A2X47_04000 [Lentisphaerae bacterium GWF2_38_69]